MLYFSNGSNMSSKRLKHRLPSASFVTVATLRHHELRFHKKGSDGSAKCDAYQTASSEHTVVGVVFDIASAEKAALDAIEGVGYGYEVKSIELVTNSGARIEAFTYYATDIDAALTPYAWYKLHVFLGTREHALPAAYIERIAAITAVADPKPERQAREMGIY